MKKTILIFTLLVFASPSFAAPYFAPGPWQDADKINPRNVPSSPDSQMCWAASISNVIAYSGWDMGLGADGVFDVFRYHFRNEGSYGTTALQWWFTGVSEYDTQDVPGGGGYFPDVDLSDYMRVQRISTAVDFLEDIDSWLRLGYGIDMAVSCPTMAHALTVYGVDTESPGIWYVDGNDRTDELIYAPLEWAWMDDYKAMGWFLRDHTWSGWSINNLVGLKPAATTTPVPEPGTALLLCFGLAMLRRRRLSLTI